MIYLEASLRAVPGKMKELMAVFEQEYLPLSNKFGRKLVAQWTTSIGTLDELVDLWAYDDLTHMQRFNEARAKSAEFAKASEHLRALIAYEEVRLMLPTSLSAMK
jgi:hypothetical protein